MKWTRLSCHDFVDNQVRLQLFAPAYNLGNFLRRLALRRSVKHWSLTLNVTVPPVRGMDWVVRLPVVKSHPTW